MMNHSSMGFTLADRSTVCPDESHELQGIVAVDDAIDLIGLGSWRGEGC